MKKFRYSLESVLNYKEQILERITDEYAECQLRVRRKEEEISVLRTKQYRLMQSFDDVKQKGAAIERYLVYSAMIEAAGNAIEYRKDQLAVLRREEEAKKKEVVDATVDVKKFVRLKEKKYREYQQAMQKEEEAFIEEFVQNAASRKN
ncbi:flagellar export protein FliJ [Bilifractor sp. LCP21S3_A7]|jgi:flagellar FliJ protein|uniref:flagellar export protein FliJ n=1 Tax=Bilifractor sp. LCP21S3_A7 TaxID=3438738 RepID=UPI003F8FD3A9